MTLLRREINMADQEEAQTHRAGGFDTAFTPTAQRRRKVLEEEGRQASLRSRWNLSGWLAALEY